uniref:Protein kinase domain-containing protein n=1 Tax=Kalanchoe fedtschenkoi TaxID=63787 RepID=A0A7N0RAD1_KALFE
MGCFNSKHAITAGSPSFDFSARASGVLDRSVASSNGGGGVGQSGEDHKEVEKKNREIGKLGRKGSTSNNSKISFTFKLGGLHRPNVEAEQAAAGWPSWLCAVASEAIHGWVPLRPDSYVKLEKIGQGTYSSVFRARDTETGKIVALKKVRFDNFQQESIRFMAREITILRRLDHPNIMKLEGVITSQMSSSIYLVFEYMEHDLSGLISSPDVKFSDAQIKCYLQQIFKALEHCHLRGVIHRDIKTSNILVNNEGVLKIADFGLANFLSARNKRPLTSRVVTLWYRPPELLLGSTNYGVSVDLWSAGCVFAELLVGKPFIKGRTEVEQLHKIFKLCGSPPEEFWSKSKLPHATMFKPQTPYESSLRERCKEFPGTAVDLLEALLSIEPQKRGTASSALMSGYFHTKPYASDPHSLPKYPPCKEIDAKNHEDAQRKKEGARSRAAPRKSRRLPSVYEEPSDSSKTVRKENAQPESHMVNRNSDIRAHVSRGKGEVGIGVPLKSSFDTLSEVSQVTTASAADAIPSGPPKVTPTGSFLWPNPKRRNVGSSMRARTTYARRGSRNNVSGPLDETASILAGEYPEHLSYRDNEIARSRESRNQNAYRFDRNTTVKHENQLDRLNPYDAPEKYHSQELSSEFFSREKQNGRRERVEMSGPLLPQPHDRIEDLLQRHESHIRNLQKSRLQREA